MKGKVFPYFVGLAIFFFILGLSSENPHTLYVDEYSQNIFFTLAIVSIVLPFLVGLLKMILNDKRGMVIFLIGMGVISFLMLVR